MPTKGKDRAYVVRKKLQAKKYKDTCTNCRAPNTCNFDMGCSVCVKCMNYINNLGLQFNGYGRPIKRQYA